MDITRIMNIETNDIQIGDRIQVDHYTATCQELPGKSLALFYLDQYLDKAMQMNKENTNRGGYEACDLRKELNSEEVLKDFSGLELVPFENGDLLRLAFYGEVFGDEDAEYFEPDDHKQWPLMKDRKNRIAERKDEDYEWGWLQNKRQGSSSNFALVYDGGSAYYLSASNSFGVRPAFLIKLS